MKYGEALGFSAYGPERLASVRRFFQTNFRMRTMPENPPHDHGSPLQEFRQFREKMNAEILGENNLVINRFFSLDTRTYEAGALDVKTKELLGLVASLVLRCDDCVTYHLTRCAEEKVTRAEMFETLSVGLVVGGSIVIPHLRRAVDRWNELEKLAK